MTLTQIKQLQDKKVQERDNLTLNRLKEENRICSKWPVPSEPKNKGGRH